MFFVMGFQISGKGGIFLGPQSLFLGLWKKGGCFQRLFGTIFMGFVADFSEVLGLFLEWNDYCWELLCVGVSG